jgi:hypothetical protein
MTAVEDFVVTGLKSFHLAWLKAKLSNDLQAEAHYKDIA